MRLRFRVYYGDGTTYSGDPFLAPASDVIAVAVQDGDGVSIRKDRDYYCWKPELGWYTCDMGGLWDYLLMHIGPKAVLVGRLVRNDRYYGIASKASREGLG